MRAVIRFALLVCSAVNFTPPATALEFVGNRIQGSITGAAGDVGFDVVAPRYGWSVQLRTTTTNRVRAALGVEPGALVLYTDLGGSAWLGFPGGEANALAVAGYRETLTINRPGLAGMSGNLIAGVRIYSVQTGSAAGGASVRGQSEATLRLGEDREVVSYASDVYPVGDDYRYNQLYSGVPVTLTTPIVFGQPLVMEISGWSSAAGAPRGSSGQFSEISYLDVYWDGMSAIELPDGSLVWDYTVTSESGFDYRYPYYPEALPVPESGSFACGVLALAALAVGAAKRRRHA